MEPAADYVRKTGARGLAIVLAFVAATQLVAVAITEADASTVMNYGVQLGNLGLPFLGPALHPLVLLLLASLASLILARLVRARRRSSPVLIILFPLAVTVFSLTTLTLSTLVSGVLARQQAFMVELGISAAIVLLLADVMYGGRTQFLGPLLMLLVSAELASYFALTIPLEELVVLILAFAAYDVYTVTRGPVREAEKASGGSPLPMISTSLGGVTLGLGDTIFYSMLPAAASVAFETTSLLGSIAAIDIGLLLTILLLKKRTLLPGLPIPMALGLLALFLLDLSGL